jgi:hypothetical protein
MRRIGVLVLLLMLAGCAAKTSGNGVATADGKPTAAASSAPPAVDDQDAALKFSQCMRGHGMTWFPDPKPGNGGLQIRIPPGQDKSKVDAAMSACKKFMPNGGAPDKADPAALAQMRQFSKCMRANGVPNFPDPTANGEMHLDSRKVGMGPGDPAFDAASKTCAKYQPKPPNGDGPGTAKG